MTHSAEIVGTGPFDGHRLNLPPGVDAVLIFGISPDGSQLSTAICVRRDSPLTNAELADGCAQMALSLARREK